MLSSPTVPFLHLVDSFPDCAFSGHYIANAQNVPEKFFNASDQFWWKLPFGTVPPPCTLAVSLHSLVKEVSSRSGRVIAIKQQYRLGQHCVAPKESCSGFRQAPTAPLAHIYEFKVHGDLRFRLHRKAISSCPNASGKVRLFPFQRDICDSISDPELEHVISLRCIRIGFL